MKKAIIWWLFSIVVACAAIVGLIQYGDNDILNLILLLLLLLSLLGGGSKATVTTVKAKRSGQASEEKWLNEHHWEKNVSAQYKNWSLSNQSSETLVFSRKIGILILVPYVFSLVFALMSRNKGNFLFRLPRPPYQAVLRKFVSLPS